jgi:DNA recombination protein RmuC
MSAVLILATLLSTGLAVWLFVRNSVLKERLAAQEKASQEKLSVLNDAQQKLSDAFKALSADALNSNNRAFLELANTALSRFQEGARSELESRQQAITETLKPLKESLEVVGTKIHQIEIARESAYTLLTEQVRSLALSQTQLHSETAKLVRALRAPATRGRWGEMQLKRVVEMAGMVDRCDFHEQQSVDTEDGRLRPDMVIHLPGNRRIVVDSKVSLSAYLDAIESTDEATRAAGLKRHAEQVRAHVGKLSKKEYWAQFDNAPEFVVAFLPGEALFSAALEQDGGLIEYGVNQRVILATPTTLIALLKAIAYGWRHEQIAKNAQEISALGGEIYDRLRTLAEHFIRVGSNLDRAVDSYNKAAATLETRVLVSARRIKEKGATVGPDIPGPDQLERAARSLQAPQLLTFTADSAEQ